MAKSKRGGKVFVDYLRNAETASAVAAYSPRARAEAGVSTPVSWDDLGRKDIRRQFTVKSVPRRLKRLGADPLGGLREGEAVDYAGDAQGPQDVVRKIALTPFCA
jgi:bifunctional non-homologous end joining protein LigD